eukprot:jgi/Ulvmu1/10244/UM060_0045.1
MERVLLRSMGSRDTQAGILVSIGGWQWLTRGVVLYCKAGVVYWPKPMGCLTPLQGSGPDGPLAAARRAKHVNEQGAYRTVGCQQPPTVAEYIGCRPLPPCWMTGV